jgi:hypothetical protein
MLLPQPYGPKNERRMLTFRLEENLGDPQTTVGLLLPLDESRGSGHRTYMSFREQTDSS